LKRESGETGRMTEKKTSTRRKAMIMGTILLVVWLCLPLVYWILPSGSHFTPFEPELVISEVFTLAVGLIAVGFILGELEKTQKR
jgi:uncharacterized membrane protein (DUF485 family)